MSNTSNAQLELTQSRLQQALAGGNIGLWDWTFADDHFDASPEVYSQLGEDADSWRSMEEFKSRLHPNDAARVSAQLADHCAGKSKMFEAIFQLRHVDGSYRRILSRAQIFCDTNNVPQRMIGTNVDITFQHEIETKFRGIFDHTFQLIGILSVEGILLEANRTALDSIGVTRNEVINQPFWETPWWCHSPLMQQRLRQAIERAANGEMDRFLSMFPTPSGDIIHVDFSLKPMLDDHGNVVFLLPEGRDVTAIHVAETELASAKAILDIAVQVANIGIWDWDVIGDKVFVSPEYLKQIGVEDRDPWSYNRFLERLHEEDRQRVDNSVRRHFTGELPQYDVTFRFRHTNGSYRWIEARGRILVDENGKPIRMVGVHLDVTARKDDQQQLEKTVEALARSNKDLEQFAYVASHDLQEPLRAVAVYCQFLEKDYADKLDAEAKRYIQVAVRAAHRMKTLIDDLLQFSRVGRDNTLFAPMDLNEIYAEAIEILQSKIEESRAQITVAELPVIVGNRSRMVQLFQNIIGNAIKYRSEAPLQIDIRSHKLEHSWRIEFRDNGIGVPQEFATEIFRVFRRLHDRKKIDGTGIGLAICERIAEMHGGRIWCESLDSGGAMFTLEIPC